MLASAFSTGFALCASLIVAIGAQNAFVLRQGLRREHVIAIVAFCVFADLVLIAAGVAGLAGALAGRPGLTAVLTVAGSVFLVWYGAKALHRAVRPPSQVHTLSTLPASASESARKRLSPGSVAAAGTGPISRVAALTQAAGFTLLNPHVYLDTVLLMGAIGSRQAPDMRVWFIGGAACASGVWFTALGFGARLLSPFFARPRAWQVLDGLVGATMLVIAVVLVHQAWPALS
jgi:L-lysine exporter family protein LysE/ArgO